MENAKALTEDIISQFAELNKWQRKFIIHIIELFLRLPGRYTFLEMEKYGKYNESTYRLNFSKAFDFAKFNLLLIKKTCERELINVFDPSFLSKSGKKTMGIGYFWSGCANQAKRGLEMSCFSAVDCVTRTARHLIAHQTLGWEEHGSLLNYYTELVKYEAKNLMQISKFIVVDAYFSKKPFVDGVLSCELEVISRFRNDVNLLYKYVGPHEKRRGPKKKYAGKINPLKLNEEHFTACFVDEQVIGYQATAYAVSLERMVKVVVVHFLDHLGKVSKVKVFFSTNLALDGALVFDYYKLRFQSEFLYRDSKQHVGLQHCQSTSATKIHFHLNAALTALCVAKASHFSDKFNAVKPFSILNIKRRNFNQWLLDLIISKFGFLPNNDLFDQNYRQICDLGKIVA